MYVIHRVGLKDLFQRLNMQYMAKRGFELPCMCKLKMHLYTQKSFPPELLNFSKF